MIDGWCENCPYHSFPYNAQVPVKIGNDYPFIDFKSEDDVWYIINKLIEEIDSLRAKGKNVNLVSSIYQQTPFFACKNIFLSPQHQKSIQKYMYCKDFSISPREGSYGKQSNRWIETALTIKNAISAKEAEAYEKANNEAKRKQNVKS